jgi:hypothetical protein
LSGFIAQLSRAYISVEGVLATHLDRIELPFWEILEKIENHRES